MDISGKVALVTGGASGIGKALVDMLLQKKAKVVYITGRNENVMKDVQDEFHKKYGDGKVEVIKCDASSTEQMEAMFKKIKSSADALHIVCNNAGIMNEVEWQLMLQINLNGVIIGTKLATEYMDGESLGGGVIINVASVAGLGLVPFMPIYATSKYAVIGFTRVTAAFDPLVIKKKLRVNVVCPPCVDTPLTNQGKLRIAEPRYQQACDGIFNSMRPYIQPADFVKQCVRLIEEPHNGEAMFVQDGETSHLIPDQTKLFRDDVNFEELATNSAKGFAEKMSPTK